MPNDAETGSPVMMYRWSYHSLPPSIMMSPFSRRGLKLSMVASTGDPALTRNITRLQQTNILPNAVKLVGIGARSLHQNSPSLLRANAFLAADVFLVAP